MGLAPLQRQRFIYLLGPRYTGSDKIKLVCRQYNTYHENYVRVMEILREIYWESKRAPSINTTMIENPYRRETIRKKFLGRTKEERLAKLQELAKKEEQNKLEVEAAELGLKEQNREKMESQRRKRREYAAKRLQLGFNDKGKEEVEDTVLDELEYKDSQYQKQIEEKKERKPVKVVTEIKGISKAELDSLLLREEEKFKPI